VLFLEFILEKESEKESKKAETTDRNTNLKKIEEIKEGNKLKSGIEANKEVVKQKPIANANKSIIGNSSNKSNLPLNKKLSKLNDEDED